MEPTLCTRPECDEPAAGYGRWEPRRAATNPNPYPRPPVECRVHHLETIGPQIVRCQVTGPATIVDIRTGGDISAPGTVELDPAETNIAALVAGGLVKILPVEAKTAPKKA